MSGGKAAVVYHYFERDLSYRDNLIFFLSTALDEVNDFYVVIAGDCTLDLPELPNLTYIRAENKNLDFGGYVEFVRQVPNLERYDHLLFVNCSVRGPYLPAYMRESWVDLFIQRLTGDVHLVGSTINMVSGHRKSFRARYGDENASGTHVQTTAYAMTREAFAYLRGIGFYDVTEALSKDAVILHYELGMSYQLIKNNMNITCLLPLYDKIDYRKVPDDINFTSRNGDALFSHAFFGRSLDPGEVVFVKTLRDMILRDDINSHTYTALASVRSIPGIAAAKDELLARCKGQVVRAEVLRQWPEDLLDRIVRKVQQKLRAFHSRRTLRRAGF